MMGYLSLMVVVSQLIYINCQASSIWVPIGNQTFHYSSEPRSWSSARDYCVGLGADLAQPSDLRALASYMDSKGSLYWIGGTDCPTEGEWRWVNGAKITGGWGPGHAGDQDGHCLAMQPPQGATSLYHLPCVGVMPCICQRHQLTQ